MRTCTTLALVLGLLFSASAAQAATRSPDPRWQHVEDDGGDFCDPESFEKMFPWTLNDDLHAEVDDIVVMTYILNILPLGGLWAPLILLPDEHPDMKAGDVLVSYLVPAAVGWGVSWLLGSWLIFPLCPGVFLACYTAPTAALNAWDRAYKCGGSDSGSAPPKSRKKSKKGDSAPPPKPSDGGDEAYGY